MAYTKTHNKPAMLLLALLGVMLLSACTTSGNPLSKLKKSNLEVATAKEFAGAQSISHLSRFTQEDVFKIGDIAEVTVHGFEDFSGTYVVDRTGKIHFIHIGELQVEGTNITDLQASLRQSYGRCCLQNPSVSIKKESQKLGTIVVDGAVKEPGAFELLQVIKLSQAVALAGGATIDSNREQVIIAREINNERKIMTVNLRDVQTRGANDPLIYPNDVIFVQDNQGRIMFNDFIRTVPILSAVLYGVTR